MQHIKRYISTFAPNGDFNHYLDENAIIDSVLTYISISYGSYLFNPEIGTDLRFYIYQPLANSTITSLKNELESIISEFVSNVSVSNLSIVQQTSTSLTINITLSINNFYKDVTLNINENNIQLIQ